MEEKKLAKIRKNNMKLYPIYEIVGLDWKFYYGIRVLFFTQVKNISAADIVLSGSFYAFCYILFQVFNTVLVGKIGKKNGIVLGQCLNLIAMCIILYCPNFTWLLIVQAICAMGFSLKGISESSFLTTSLPKTKKKGEIFTKIYSKGYAGHCFMGASSVLISGFLYAINPYLPIIFSIIVNIFAVIVSINFIDIEKVENIQEKKEIKEEVHDIMLDLKEAFKFIFYSKRLRALLLFIGAMWGIIDVYATYQETLLKELAIPSYYIGFILAGFQMLVGIFSTKSNRFNRKYKNHTLTYIGLMIATGSIVLGIITIFNIPFHIQLMFITAVFIIRAYGKGIFQILKKRYMNNFANNKIISKIYSVDGIMENLGRMIIGIVASAILKVTILPNALVILGTVCTLIVVLLSLYSKSRLGLKPEQYNKEDIPV